MKHLTKILLVSIATLILLGIYCDRQLTRAISVSGADYYEIKSGNTLNSVINDLLSKSIVSTYGPIFRVYGLLTRYQGTVKAGEYELNGTLDAKSLLRLFRSGKVVQRSITFPEGWDFLTWRHHLQSHRFISQTLNGLSDRELMERLDSDASFVEGQFFPDTYLFVRDATDISILKRAHDKMKNVVEREWNTRDQGDPGVSLLGSPAEALVLASIIEKETGNPADREFIASVFSNRLAKKMRLQSDPTVIYGVDNFDGNLTRSHLSAASPYNTYIIRGLPPTPICNPGLASIRASLRPAKSGYLYFVARGDGSSEFSYTLAEHNAAVTRFQKAGRVEGYRSSPRNK